MTRVYKGFARRRERRLARFERTKSELGRRTALRTRRLRFARTSKALGRRLIERTLAFTRRFRGFMIKAPVVRIGFAIRLRRRRFALAIGSPYGFTYNVTGKKEQWKGLGSYSVQNHWLF